MCWSGEASAALATIGFAGTFYAAAKSQSPLLWLPLFYFSLMELLQAFTYTVIDRCWDTSNQVATFLGYLHITFQPFFINMISMFFIPDRVRHKIQLPVYAMCCVGAALMLLQLVPFEWAGTCDARRPLCGDLLCSFSGNWHIAWSVPTNGIGNWFVGSGIPLLGSGFIFYMAVGFFMPLFYGSWRFTIYHLLMGPFLASLLTDNHNERPAVWCLLSIGFLLLVAKTRLRHYLHVRNWPAWKWFGLPTQVAGTAHHHLNKPHA